MAADDPKVDVADAGERERATAREAFAAAARAAAAAGATGSAGGAGPAGDPPRPKADLLTLAATLASQAMLHLGVLPHPLSKQVRKDLAQARYAIDLLGVLEAKTRGNLTAEEERVLQNLLADLRMRYVQAG